MICPKCGVYVVETNPVCRNCGCRFAEKEDNKKQAKVVEKVPTDINSKPRFYKTTWFMWIMLLTIYPVGLFLMWKYKKHNIVVRIIVSAIILIGIVFANTDLSDKVLTSYYASMSSYDGTDFFAGMNKNTKELEEKISFKNITVHNMENKSVTKGDIINLDDKIHSFALSISYYDENNKLLSVAKGIITGVQPDSSKKFEAVSYKVPVNYKYYKTKIDFIVQ